MGIKVELQIWEAKWISVGIWHILYLLLNLKACGICQSWWMSFEKMVVTQIHLFYKYCMFKVHLGQIKIKYKFV